MLLSHRGAEAIARRSVWHKGCIKEGEETKPGLKQKTMRKSVDLIAENIRTAKHPFRHVIDQPHKEQKHRYERRKVKEYIRLIDWMVEA